jgi:hypothetical protein
VRNVFMTNSTEATYIPLLNKIIQEGSASAVLTDIFNFERAFTQEDIISLLFYMGWLTIKDAEEGFYSFTIPNLVIRELYYDYFVVLSEQETNLNRNNK